MGTCRHRSLDDYVWISLDDGPGLMVASALKLESIVAPRRQGGRHLIGGGAAPDKQRNRTPDRNQASSASSRELLGTARSATEPL